MTSQPSTERWIREALQRAGDRPGVFAAAGALRVAAAALADSRTAEQAAEAADALAHDAWRSSEGALADTITTCVAALRRPPAAWSPQAAPLADALTAALADYRSPFAADARGEAELSRLEVLLRDLPHALLPPTEGLRAAIVALRQRGSARDAAAENRRAAIRDRARRTAAWREAVEELEARCGGLANAPESLRSVGEGEKTLDDDWFLGAFAFGGHSLIR